MCGTGFLNLLKFDPVNLPTSCHQRSWGSLKIGSPVRGSVIGNPKVNTKPVSRGLDHPSRGRDGLTLEI